MGQKEFQTFYRQAEDTPTMDRPVFFRTYSTNMNPSSENKMAIKTGQDAKGRKTFHVLDARGKDTGKWFYSEAKAQAASRALGSEEAYVGRRFRSGKQLDFDDMYGEQAMENPYGFFARRNMAGRPGKFGLPTVPVGKGKKAKALAQLPLSELVKLSSVSAKKEIARRTASRHLRTGLEHPDRVAKRKAKKNGWKKR